MRKNYTLLVAILFIYCSYTYHFNITGNIKDFNSSVEYIAIIRQTNGFKIKDIPITTDSSGLFKIDFTLVNGIPKTLHIFENDLVFANANFRFDKKEKKGYIIIPTTGQKEYFQQKKDEKNDLICFVEKIEFRKESY